MANDLKIVLTETDPLRATITSVRTRLDQLSDVVEDDVYKQDGSLLVYNRENDTYILMDILTYDRETRSYVLDGGESF